MKNLIIQITEHERHGECKWELINLIASGTEEDTPTAYDEAYKAQEAYIMEEQSKMATPVPRTMAPNPDPEMVPTPLTIAQREQLYKLVYGECSKYVWPTGLDLLTILHNK